MNKFLVSLGVAGACFVSSVANAAISVIDTAWYNGHTYYLLAEQGPNGNAGTTWTNSESFAQTVLNTDLVTINDAAENNWLLNQWGLQTSLWLGLRRNVLNVQTGTAPVFNFAWDSGEAITYTNWEFGEPNNCCFGESYTQMIQASQFAPGQWNDLSNTDGYLGPKYGVAEKLVPEPTTLALIGMAFLSLFGFGLLRRRAEA